MPIDRIIAKASQLIQHYWTIAVDAPTHFTMAHWVVFSTISVLIGFFCMRGFGSRKDF